MSYLNKLLADFYNQGKEISSKTLKNINTKTTAKTKDDYAKHEYTKEQMSSVFDSLDDVEI